MKRVAPLAALALFLFSTTLFSQSIRWRKLDRPLGGTLLPLAAGQNGLLIGAAGSRLYRSTDDGIRWEIVSSWPSTSNAQSIHIGDDGMIYAATGSTEFYRSSDGGLSWSRGGIGLNDGPLTAFTIASNGDLYGGTYNGSIYRSSDRGTTWSRAGSTGEMVRVLGVDADGVLYAGVSSSFGGRILRSTDNGATWTNGYQVSDQTLITSIAVDDAGWVVVMGAYDLYRSSDKGISWEVVDPSASAQLLAMTASPADGLFMGGVDGQVYASSDHGASWTVCSTPKLNVGVFSMTSSAHIYAATAFGGIYRSSDRGASWTEVTGNLATTSATAIGVDQFSGDVIAGFWNQGLYRSSDDGESWVPLKTDLRPEEGEHPMAISLDDIGTIYVAAWRAMLRSSDGGSTWEWIQPGEGSISTVTARAEEDGYPELYAGSGSGHLYRSSDEGRRWEELPLGATSWVYGIAIAPNGNVFVGTGNEGVYRSTDGGRSWKNTIALANGTSCAELMALAVTPNGDVYAGGRLGVMRTTDDGESWHVVGNWDQWGMVVRSLAVGPDGRLYAGTLGSDVWMLGEGDEWIELSTGLVPGESYMSLAVNRRGWLFAGSEYNGIFRSERTTLSVPVIVAQPTASIICTPNPATTRTTIVVDLVEAGAATVRLLDARGQVVSTAFDGTMAAGRNECTIDVVPLPAGVYLCEVIVSGVVSTARVVVVK